MAAAAGAGKSDAGGGSGCGSSGGHGAGAGGNNGGAKGGTVVGQTDDYGYNIVRDGVHVHDLNATVLHLLGINHERLTFRYQGRDFRLTDIHGEVVRGALA